MIGPGKYDALCSYVREQTKATGAIVIVMGGNHGDGFSAQTDALTLISLPKLLESVAAQIRADMKKGKL
jgi:molybdopterin synthase catalytic subunit